MPDTPSANDSIATPKLSLGVALQRYWWHLIGVTIFPACCCIGMKYLHIPFLAFAPLFYAVGAHAMWPVWKKRAPYSFWMVACGLWMIGAFFAVFVLSIIHLLLTGHL